ncbi:MAG TPA: hypothetical protein PLL77_09055 [Pyrinomonadaceae bacterium]|nr:hypothetical protein [Pyrinomonadaceae bacterium]
MLIMDAVAQKQHSKLGIASCLMAFCVWLYFAVMLYLVFFADGFTKWLNDLFVPESRGISDFRGMGTAVVVFAVIFFLIPVAGHIFGLIMGAIGIILPKNKRLFPAAGIALNLLPVVILSIFYLIGTLSPS